MPILQAKTHAEDAMFEASIKISRLRFFGKENSFLLAITLDL
jgi:hypothetical protein